MTVLAAGLVASHEFGHNFGSEHDAQGAEPANGYFLMCGTRAFSLVSGCSH